MITIKLKHIERYKLNTQKRWKTKDEIQRMIKIKHMKKIQKINTLRGKNTKRHKKIYQRSILQDWHQENETQEKKKR